MKHLLTIEDAVDVIAARGGGKAANLARLGCCGMQVPAWFCLAADAFDLFVKENGLEGELRPGVHLGDLGAFARDVEALFLRHRLPASVKDALRAGLVGAGLDHTRVAVRSSGIDEDSVGHSFAGQFSSFLGRTGVDDIAEAVRRCWASGFSERALNYRLAQGLPIEGIRVGVVVQAMIDAAAAGVAFSRDPAHPFDRANLVVDSVFGLGEGLVSGDVDADHFVLARDTLELRQTTIAAKVTLLRYDRDGGVRREALDPDRGGQASIGGPEIRAIGAMVLGLERRLGTPQDAEWVIDDDRVLYVVQTRPITTLPPDAFFDPTINGNAIVLWDNSNIVESYSGVTTPLTFTFASAAYHRVYVQFCEVMGVPRDEISAYEPMYRNMLGLVRGHVYYNLINWYRLIRMLPLAGSSQGFMETMMGVKQSLAPDLAAALDFPNSPARYPLHRRFNSAVRAAWRFVRIDAIVARFTADFDRVYDEARRTDFAAMSLPELSSYYRAMDTRVLGNWRAPIINDFVCMVSFGILKRLTEAWLVVGDEAASLQNDLLCGEGGLESTAPTKQLMATARWIEENDESLKAWLLATPAAEAWPELRDESRSPDLLRHLEAYLDAYGFRCVDELKLEQRDLHDDPTFIIGALTGYLRTGATDAAALEARERAIRSRAEAVVRDRCGPLRRAIYRPVLGYTRRAVRNRENLRFARTKIFGIARRVFRAMGAKLSRMGAIEREDDVFYLTLDEVLAYVEGRSPSLQLAVHAASRRDEFDRYRRSAPPPERFVTHGAAGASFAIPAALAEGNLLRDVRAPGEAPRTLRGTPCSPGIVEGIVRVARTSQDAEGLENEILVTARTDPGWVPLYPSCAGLLIERGSLLSHSAVVARELGLPTIVGISGGLMTQLRTGQRVRMDAERGEVEILE